MTGYGLVTYRQYPIIRHHFRGRPHAQEADESNRRVRLEQGLARNYRFAPDSGVSHTGWRGAPATGTLDTAVDLPSLYL